MSWFGGAKNSLHFKMNKKRKALQSKRVGDGTSSFERFEMDQKEKSSMQSPSLDLISKFSSYGDDALAVNQEKTSSGAELLNMKNSNSSTLSSSNSKKDMVTGSRGTKYDENWHMNAPKEMRVLVLPKKPIKFSAMESENHRKRSRDEFLKNIKEISALSSSNIQTITKETTTQPMKSQYFPSSNKELTRPVFSPLHSINQCEKGTTNQTTALAKTGNDEQEIIRPIFSPCI